MSDHLRITDRCPEKSTASANLSEAIRDAWHPSKIKNGSEERKETASTGDQTTKQVDLKPGDKPSDTNKEITGDRHRDLEKAQECGQQYVEAMMSGKYDQALKYAQAERRIFMHYLGPDDPAVAQANFDCGDASRLGDQLPQAEGYYKEAMRIFEKNGNQEFVGHCLRDLGEVYRDEGRFKEGEESYKKALSILEKVRPDSIYVADTLTGYALLLDRRGQGDDHQRAAAMRARAKEIRKNLEKPPFTDPIRRVPVEQRGQIPKS